MLPSKKVSEISNLRNVFDHFFTSGIPIFAEPNIKISVAEEEGSYEVKAELPGVQKEDIQIEFEEDHLIVSATKEGAQKVEKENYLYQEITNGQVMRSIYLPGIEPNNTEATYQDGILTMMVPKKERDDKDSRIKIEIK